MGPSHTRGCAQVSEPLRNEPQWYSELYSIWGSAKFVSLMYKHTPMPSFCYGTEYIYIYIYVSSFAKPAAFSRGAERFSTLYMQHLISRDLGMSEKAKKQLVTSQYVDPSHSFEDQKS